MHHHTADVISQYTLLIVIWRIAKLRHSPNHHTKSLELTFKVGEAPMSTVTTRQQITLSVTPVDLNGIAVTGATLSELTFTSSDATIATVGTPNADGTFPVTVLKVGSVTITATASVTDPDGLLSHVTGTGTLDITAGADDAEGKQRTVSLSLTFTVA